MKTASIMKLIQRNCCAAQISQESAGLIEVEGADDCRMQQWVMQNAGMEEKS